MATEVAILPLREGQDPQDASSEAGRSLKKIFGTLSQQKGFQRVYWGTEHENSKAFRLFVDWDSIEDHKAFANKGYVL